MVPHRATNITIKELPITDNKLQLQVDHLPIKIGEMTAAGSLTKINAKRKLMIANLTTGVLIVLGGITVMQTAERGTIETVMVAPNLTTGPPIITITNLHPKEMTNQKIIKLDEAL